MAREVMTQIEINATPQRVWQVLTDFENYPTWNPFVKYIKGEVREGKHIEVLVEPPGSKGMVFKPLVLAFAKNREFRWLGNFVMPGIFDGEHIFILIDNGDGTTTFKHSERFRGILVPLFWKGMKDNIAKGFESMNQKLKERAETQAELIAAQG